MRHFIRFLARLYPAPWRAKYGAEFDALLLDSRADWRAALNVFTGAMTMQFTKWGYGRFAMSGLGLGFAVALAVALLIPEQYRSEGVLRGPSDAASREALARAEQDALSRASLVSLIQRRNLYLGERSRMPLQDVIEKMRQHIRFTALDPPGSVSVQFEYPDKYLAQSITQTLMLGLDAGPRKLNLETIDTPSLPIDPSSTPRIAIAGGGLVAGMLSGLLFAYFIRRRQHSAICPTCGHRMASLTAIPH